MVPISLSVASSLLKGFHFKSFVMNSTTSLESTSRCATSENARRLQDPSSCWLARMLLSTAGVFAILEEEGIL